jgi:DNA-binding NarL/FixJ family response regulator
MLADDQATMRDAMRNLLMLSTDVVSVALANDGAQAILLGREGGLDVAVLDIQMPVMSGMRALEALQRERPSLPVVMLSTSTDAYTVQQCLKLGAIGFVSKLSASDELVAAVRAVAVGTAYLCRIVRASLAASGDYVPRLMTCSDTVT